VADPAVACKHFNAAQLDAFRPGMLVNGAAMEGEATRLPPLSSISFCYFGIRNREHLSAVNRQNNQN